MIAMNTKYWQCNVQVWIHVIDVPMISIAMGKVGLRVTDQLDRHGTITKDMLLEDLHTLMFAISAWTIFMEQIAAEKYKVNILVNANLKTNVCIHIVRSIFCSFITEDRLMIMSCIQGNLIIIRSDLDCYFFVTTVIP